MSESVPKAILYVWPTSVWSTVPRLCLMEKGYSSDEYITKFVDIGKGENFAPSYLRINHYGTIPTLVVPTLETTSAEVETRYRSLKDTVTICDFLDRSRNATSKLERPAPALQPATIEGKSLSDQIINLVHKSDVDPNFLNMSASDKAELHKKALARPGKILRDRKAAFAMYIAEAKEQAGDSGAPSFEGKIVAFLVEKSEANDAMYGLYFGKDNDEQLEVFFNLCRSTWKEKLPAALNELEAAIKGPYTLGDQISLSDLHLVSWLTRVVSVAGGEPTVAGIAELEKRLEGYRLGPKLRTFYQAWTERESFKEILVPANVDFLKFSGYLDKNPALGRDRMTRG
ncbi:hypothetical protein BCR39DRAFT_514352 [Naematelia encephala]|uniref:GST N-terminal domain-containing protein n=1 Tax=Naematelia encephala TaxID=71784 RepID=A0A1Y2BKX3_9TREE|nr:hypothetical protein BCR39DRAFT_514352 [Naematelia encephala]